MCRFLSAIVRRNGDILCNPLTDSHEELIALHGLRDSKEGAFARVEYSPPDSASIADLSKYRLTIDEQRTPDWFDESMRDRVTSRLRDIVSRMIVTDHRPILLGGTWIIADGARIDTAKLCRIVAMHGGTITFMRGGTVTHMRGGAITNMDGGTVTYMHDGTIADMHDGTIADMYGGTIAYMHGGAITDMRGGTITDMRGGTITDMRGGTITDMRGGKIKKDRRPQHRPL